MSKNPCFIIAEAGVNHNGSLAMAKRLIDAAVDAKADAVKFQTFHAEKLVTGVAPKADYQLENTRGDESQWEMLKKLELSDDDHRKLFHYCSEKKIVFMSSPFDEESVDFLHELGMKIFKVGSGELTNKPLLQHIARKGRPMIVSTGLAYLEEVARAVQWIAEARKEAVEEMNSSDQDQDFFYPLVLLHCVTEYPALPEEVNLRAIRTMQEAFHLPVGYSDHTLGTDIAIAASTMGAVVVEKHLTLAHDMEGPDHKASSEPQELVALVKGVRNVEAAMGDGIKKPSSREESLRAIVRRSLVAARNLMVGEILSASDVAVKRPGVGIAPEFRDAVMGKKVVRNIDYNDAILWEDLRDA